MHEQSYNARTINHNSDSTHTLVLTEFKPKRKSAREKETWRDSNSALLLLLNLNELKLFVS